MMTVAATAVTTNEAVVDSAARAAMSLLRMGRPLDSAGRCGGGDNAPEFTTKRRQGEGPRQEGGLDQVGEVVGGLGGWVALGSLRRASWLVSARWWVTVARCACFWRAATWGRRDLVWSTQPGSCRCGLHGGAFTVLGVRLRCAAGAPSLWLGRAFAFGRGAPPLGLRRALAMVWSAPPLGLGRAFFLSLRAPSPASYSSSSTSVSSASAGTNQMTPCGGSCRIAEAGRPCHGLPVASTSP